MPAQFEFDRSSEIPTPATPGPNALLDWVASEWSLALHSDGEVLTARAETESLQAIMLGFPRGRNARQVKAKLSEILRIAEDAAQKYQDPKQLPGLLHFTLKGLLAWQAEIERKKRSRPVHWLVLFASGPDAAFAHIGGDAPEVSVGEAPVAPPWVTVEGPEGQEAKGFVLYSTTPVDVRVRWAAAWGDEGETLTALAEWRGTSLETVAFDPEHDPLDITGQDETADALPDAESDEGRSTVDSEWASRELGADVEQDVEPTESEASTLDDANTNEDEPHPARRGGLLGWIDRLISRRRRDPAIEAMTEIAHDVPGVPDWIPETPEVPSESLAEPSADLPLSWQLDSMDEQDDESNVPAEPPRTEARADRSDLAWEQLRDELADITAASAAAGSYDSNPLDGPAATAARQTSRADKPTPNPEARETMPVIESAARAEAARSASEERAARQPIEPAESSATFEMAKVIVAPEAPKVDVAVEPAGAPQASEAPVAPAMAEAADGIEAHEAAVVAGDSKPDVAAVWTESLESSDVQEPEAQPVQAHFAPAPAIVERRSPPPPLRPAWPEVSVERAPARARPRLATLAIVAALFASGWLIGTFQGSGSDPAGPRAALDRLLQTLGIAGAQFTCEIVSDPAGAWISVDGKELPERTPTRLALAPGEHVVELSLPGRGAGTFQVNGERGQTVNLTAPLHGTLEIRGASRLPIEVAVDGDVVGLAPLTVEDVTPGTHTLSFKGPGVQPWEQTVEVRVNETSQVLARPFEAPETGLVEVRASLGGDQAAAQVEGASVWVDGEHKGSTPLTLELPRGPHSIRVVHGEATAPIQIIDLPGGNQRFALFRLGELDDLPRLELISGPASASDDQPGVVSVSVHGLAASEIQEMWMHARTSEGAWRRYPMARLESPSGTVGVSVFPQELFGEGGTARYYASALTRTGEEIFTEIEDTSAKKGRKR